MRQVFLGSCNNSQEIRSLLYTRATIYLRKFCHRNNFPGDKISCDTGTRGDLEVIHISRAHNLNLSLALTEASGNI